MTIDDLIRDATAKRQIVALNLWPAINGQWQGNVSADRVAWSVGLDDDPVEALRKALKARLAVAGARDLEDMLS